MLIVILFSHAVYEHSRGVRKDGMCNEHDDDEELWSFVAYTRDLEPIRKRGL